MAACKKGDPSPLSGTHSIFFRLAPLRRKNHSGIKSSGCPDIAFYDPHHPQPGSKPLNCQGPEGDQLATI
jgi:hypothetical protein